jgi:signal peptidase II
LHRLPGHSRGVRIEATPEKRGRREFYSAAVAALVADQASKVLVRAVVPEGDAVTLIPRVLEIASQYNAGAAFGVLQGAGPLLILICLVAIFAVIKLRKQRARSRLLAVSLGLILGGAVGNLIDRLAFGAVFDFIDFHVWPVFNLADVAVTVGGALLLIYWAIVPREQT